MKSDDMSQLKRALLRTRILSIAVAVFATWIAYKAERSANYWRAQAEQTITKGAK